VTVQVLYVDLVVLHELHMEADRGGEGTVRGLAIEYGVNL
jgi:hypothetical protein